LLGLFWRDQQRPWWAGAFWALWLFGLLLIRFAIVSKIVDMNRLPRAKAEADKWVRWWFADKPNTPLETIENARRIFIEKWLDNYKVK
jgi:hypothetical protein